MDLPLTPILFPVIGKYLNTQLTPEVASQLAGEILARCYPGPVDTSGIEPKKVGSFVIECARLAHVVDQLRAIHEQHWRETEGYRHALEFNPDYQRGIDLEVQGRYLLIVARRHETGEIVGNYALYLSRSMHTQTLMATEDTLFLAKDCRRGRLGIEVMRYAENALRQRGVEELNVSVKLVNSVGSMIERMGYAPVATQYTKILKEQPDVLT